MLKTRHGRTASRLTHDSTVSNLLLFEHWNLFRVSDFEFRISHARVKFEIRLGE